MPFLHFNGLWEMFLDIGCGYSRPWLVIATACNCFEPCEFVGNPAAACRYMITRAIEGRLYTFAAVSFLPLNVRWGLFSTVVMFLPLAHHWCVVVSQFLQAILISPPLEDWFASLPYTDVSPAVNCHDLVSWMEHRCVSCICKLQDADQWMHC